MPDITNILTALATVLDVLLAVIGTALVVSALYGIGWVLYQLDYLDFLDPEDLISLPPHLDTQHPSELENHVGGTQ